MNGKYAWLREFGVTNVENITSTERRTISMCGIREKGLNACLSRFGECNAVFLSFFLCRFSYERGRLQASENPIVVGVELNVRFSLRLVSRKGEYVPKRRLPLLARAFMILE